MVLIKVMITMMAVLINLFVIELIIKMMKMKAVLKFNLMLTHLGMKKLQNFQPFHLISGQTDRMHRNESGNKISLENL